MSKRWLRHYVTALICGLVPLIPAGPVQASSPVHVASPIPAAARESAVLTKFRDSGPPVMQRAAAFEATATPSRFAPAPPVKAQKTAAMINTRLFREVFGFAFASSLGDPTIGYPSWNFSLLSTVAYFGIHVDWTGDFSGGSALNTWNDLSGPVPGFIQTAHASGTKVVLTIAMFDSTSGTPNMCSALQRGDVTIRRAVAEVLAKGIDGVNVDYESNNTTCTEPSTGATQSSQSLFTSFVHGLRVALDVAKPLSYLSVDTYSGAAGYRDSLGNYLGFFNIGALALDADSFFVMAYDMEYSNWDSPPLSCPSFCLGPTAPLSTYLFNDTRASAEYRAVVPASKVIMGIPYYGRKECVAVPDPNQIPPNAMGSSVGADGYLDASTENGYPGNTLYVSHRETRDPLGATRWDTFSSVAAGCNREMYWDDTTALGNKYNLIINDHLRGAGIFALNYGGGAPELWDLINLKFGQCSQASISADKTAPQVPNTTITLSAYALCAGTGEFRFWMAPPGGALNVTQPYSTATTLSWNTTGQPLGTYTFQVDARNHGSSVGLDTSARMTFQLALCVTPTLTADKAAPQLLGTVITLTPAVTCNGTPDYQFWVQPPGGAWTLAQDYGGAATFRWDTSHLGYGNYNISVHVRTVGTTVAYESLGSIPYSLTSCISAALTTNKTSPQPTGSQIGLTGSATCDSSGAPQYRFMIQPPGGSWSVVQDFGIGTSFTWNGGDPGGTYNLELDAKSTPAPASTMATASLVFVLSSCSAVTLASSPASPQFPGPTVVLTGAATCPAMAQYRFSVHKPDGTDLVQDYGAANTFSWNTTGLALGTYGLTVDARNAGATGAYEAVATANYVLADPACTTPTVATDIGSPQGIGTDINFTATTTVCPHPLYQYWVMFPGTNSWIVAQAYSSNASFHWNTTHAIPGDYRFSAWVRDAFSGSSISSDLGGSYDAFVAFADTLTSAPCSAMSVSAAAPGTQVTITGSATCSHTSPLYEFWMRPASQSSWQLVQGWSTTATYNAGALAGTVYFSVWVHDASSAGVNGSGSARYDSYASMPYPGCASVTTSPVPTTVMQSSSGGTHVIITAAATGCTSSPRYEFWMRPANSNTWQLVQGYGTSATYDWNSTGALAGTAYFSAWVRDANSTTSYDAFASTPVTVTTPSCASVTVTAAPTSVVHTSANGTHVTITAAATGCTNSPRYEFWMRPAGSSSWQLVQGYGTGATYDWNSTGALAGTVYFSAWVRDANSPASYDAFASTLVAVT